MKAGNTFTIEPMISEGTWRDEQWVSWRTWNEFIRFIEYKFINIRMFLIAGWLDSSDGRRQKVGTIRTDTVGYRYGMWYSDRETREKWTALVYGLLEMISNYRRNNLTISFTNHCVDMIKIQFSIFFSPLFSFISI